jgi:RNA polymerase-binding protein DksA
VKRVVKAKPSPSKPAAKAAAKPKVAAKAAKATTKSTKPAAKSAPKAVKAAPKAAVKTKTPAKKALAAAKGAKPAAKAVKAKAVAAKAPAKAAAAKSTKATKVAKAPAVKAPPKILKPALVPKPAPSRPVLSEVAVRKHRSPAVAASTLDRLRVLLLEEQGNHARQAEGLQAEAEALANEREPGDTQFDEESGEGDTLSVERERDLALSTAARQTVDEIEKALARMDDGTYGYCEVCGDRIPVPRLEAIPWADQCVKCKSRGERRR